MVRPNRVKVYRFPSGSLVADANGNLEVFSERPLNGTLQKVFYSKGNFDIAGSLYLFISGTDEKLFTQIGNLGANHSAYIHAFPYDTDGTTGSPYIAVQPVVNSIVYLVGSGLGAGKSGTGFEIFYI